MALPFLQLSQKFLATQSVVIAALLRVHRHVVIGMATDLFAFTVEQTSNDEHPPDGLFMDAEASTILEAAMGWSGEPGRAFDVFCRTGLIEKLEVGARVRGCDRYRRTWEKNRRGKGGRNSDDEDDVPVSGTKSAGKVPEKRRKNAGKVPVEEDGDGDGSLLSSKEEEEAPPPHAVEPGDVGSFLAWADSTRSAELGATVPDDTAPSKRCETALAGALAKHGRKKCEIAFLGFLADAYWRKQDPPCPINGFTDKSQLPQYLSKAARVLPSEAAA
jgi:hypothetical protein